MTAKPIVSALVFAAALAAAAAVAAQPETKPLVVLELFQSQGCSSCPPANANINALTDRADILALSFGVTYWDQLGWKDTFATPQNTARQWDYAHGSLHNENVYTPQVVINGRKDIVGINRAELDRAIVAAETLPARPTPTISLSGSSLIVSAGVAPAGGADVWLVRFDPRVTQVSIRRGENGGKTLPHKNIVRELVRLGAWDGAGRKYEVHATSDTQLRTAVLLQAIKGGPIIAALKAP